MNRARLVVKKARERNKLRTNQIAIGAIMMVLGITILAELCEEVSDYLLDNMYWHPVFSFDWELAFEELDNAGT